MQMRRVLIYRLPVGDTSADILSNLDDRISTGTTDMQSKKVSKLLPCPSLDWWTFVAKSMVLNSSEDLGMVNHQFVAGAKCQPLVAKMASILWANRILKCWSAMLTKAKDNIAFESFMDLRNTPLSDSSELFHKETAKRAIEKSSRVLHSEVIRKAVSQDKPAKKFTKRLQFSRQPQSPERCAP